MLGLFRTKRNAVTQDLNCRKNETFGKHASIDQDALVRSAATICQFFASINDQLVRQNKLLIKDLKLRQQDKSEIKACFDITSDCQEQTAELANQALERHALYPAIMTVEQLADLLKQIAHDAQLLDGDQETAASITQPFMDSIHSAAKIAQSKIEQLEIVMICPTDLDELDSSLHEIVKAVATDDPDKNRKICQTVTPGISYRGKTLRTAKVAVYRFEAKKGE